MNIISNLFAQRVIDNKTAFANVPAKLKDQVRELLIEYGHEELVIEE